MAGLHLPHVLMVLCAITALNCASTLPRDIIFPTANEKLVENSQPIAYPPSANNQPLRIPEQEEKPKGCFHFYVSRNMSSLLAEATKMLRTIRDRREREWILTFIYRIKSLAEHLRAHPDSRNYDCLSNDEETKKRILSEQQQQPELYFVDDVPKRSGEDEEGVPVEKSSNDNQESATEQSPASSDDPPKQEESVALNPPSPPSQVQTESSAETASDSTLAKSPDGRQDAILSKQDVTTSVQGHQESSVLSQEQERSVPEEKRKRTDIGDIVLSSAPDCDDTSTECRNIPVPPSSPENYFADAGNIYPLYQAEEDTEELYQKEALKERIRKALLEELAPEIKKLRTVGGTENDLLSIWNSNYVQEDKSAEETQDADFDYEETGAAAGDLNLNEKIQPDRTVAPSLDEVQNSKENPNSGKDSSYEPYDDSDVLVQQLFDVRYNNNPPSKTTKSLSDQNNEYLITSTHTPF